MKQAVLLVSVFVLSLAALITAQGNRESLSNPKGTINLECGVPGPEGPRGERGPKGDTGDKGRRGLQGLKGDKGSMDSKGMKGQTGGRGQKGRRGSPGPLGPTGAPGLRGPQGIQGEPGDTVLNEKELDRVKEIVIEAINASISERIAAIESKLCKKVEDSKERKPEITLCGITSANWTRVAYLDTTQDQTCPPELRTYTNTGTNQTACGTLYTIHSERPSASMTFPTNRRYTHVCGRVRGYVYYYGGGFVSHVHRGQRIIDSIYMDGVSITRGSPRKHLWSYVIGVSETIYYQYQACPCARSDYVASNIPHFVGNHFYCESAFVTNIYPDIIWEDALWDGENCITKGNTCCNRFGWFHREVPPTEDPIEVRWMKHWPSANSDLMTDQLEIWVM